MRRTTILAGFSAATLLTGMTLTATAGENPTGPKGTGEHVCTDSQNQPTDYVVTWTPKQIFPPNHKLAPVQLAYTSPEDGERLDLTILGMRHNEVFEDGTEWNGTGNTPVLFDTVGTGRTGVNESTTAEDRDANVGVEVVAERSGRGTGRTYFIDFEGKATKLGAVTTPLAVANQGESNTCRGTATVFIPHDMGQGNDEKA